MVRIVSLFNVFHPRVGNTGRSMSPDPFYVLRVGTVKGVTSVARSGSRERVAGINFTDPSAGSPTETLLRLVLPLNGVVRGCSLGLRWAEPG